MAGTHTSDRLVGVLSASLLAQQPFAVRFTPVLTQLLSRLGGRGMIVGTTKLKGVPTNIPVSSLVRLYRDLDGALMASTQSDAITGAFTFTGLDETRTYTPVAIDATAMYRAVIADRVSTTRMP